MTLEDQIKLVEYFVKREPDATIKDFIEALKEFDRIDRTAAEYEYDHCAKRFYPKYQYEITSGKIYSTPEWQDKEKITVKKIIMPNQHRYHPINDFHRDYMKKHSKNFTLNEIAKKLNLTYHQVSNYIRKKKMKFKKEYKTRKKDSQGMPIEQLRKKMKAMPLRKIEEPYQFSKPPLSKLEW